MRSPSPWALRRPSASDERLRVFLAGYRLTTLSKRFGLAPSLSWRSYPFSRNRPRRRTRPSESRARSQRRAPFDVLVVDKKAPTPNQWIGLSLSEG